MARYQFRLAALQKYRESLRDQCRQILAQWLQRDAAAIAEQQRLTAEREQQLSEIRDAQQLGNQVNVDKIVTRRYRAGQLTAELLAVAQQRQQLAVQISLCRQALVKADQGVKVLERLSEHQLAEFLQVEEAKASREREEIWQAGRWRGI